MMNGYLQGMQSELALGLFSGMLMASIRPNQVTFLGALDACSNLAALCEGKQVYQMICHFSLKIRLYENMQENGYKPNDVTYVVLLSACSALVWLTKGLKSLNPW